MLMEEEEMGMRIVSKPHAKKSSRRWNSWSFDLDRDVRLSRLQCLLAVCSYLLMVSDVPRTGFGVRDLSFFTRIEPEHFVFFGPYAYPVTKQLALNTAIPEATNTLFWPYKYDSTSVAMRVVAKHLQIREWPACVTYDENCDEQQGISPPTLFKMIDSLIDRVKIHRDTHGQTGRLTLRTQHEWADRLHDYAFPLLFSSTKRRTVQATHYDITPYTSSSLCSSRSKSFRPLICDESSINFGRLCASTRPSCREIGTIHRHVPARLHKLLATYPTDHKMDVVLLEGVDDYSQSSLTFQGYKSIDVVVLARVRKCVSTRNGSAISTECETIVVDDFRYEGASLVTNVREWFWITAILRGTGQLYAWLRLSFLFVGSYFACTGDPRWQERSRYDRLRQSVRAMFLIPSQVMVYGSLFPISCYLVAHLIDAAAIYEIMGRQLMSLMGVMSLDVSEILRICAVSMRSLWPLAFVCHIVQRINTHCAWSPIHGVPGIPEFSLSFVASLTILAQVGHPALRDARILSVEELVPCATRFRWNSIHSDTSHGDVYKLLFGTIIDYKCLAVSICLYIGVVVACRLANAVLPRCFKYKVVLCTRTAVSLSAGSLWPRSALVVSWNGTVLTKPSIAQWRKILPTQDLIGESERGFVDASKIFTCAPLHLTVVDGSQSAPPPIVTTKSECCLTCPRTREIQARIFLTNLAVMTDPFTFFQLRVWPGTSIGVYKPLRLSTQCTSATTPTTPGGSNDSCRILLLPLALATACSDIPIDWRELQLLTVIHTRELDWCGLLQCG